MKQILSMPWKGKLKRAMWYWIHSLSKVNLNVVIAKLFRVLSHITRAFIWNKKLRGMHLLWLSLLAMIWITFGMRVNQHNWAETYQ